MTAPLITSLEQAGEGSRELYQPGNGCEGADFMSAFCDRCQHDAAFREGTGESCPIAANTMIYTPEDAEYPREWVYGDDDEPTCTAFTPTNQEQPNV